MKLENKIVLNSGSIGFSLVELMVAVGIIGVLTAIAIPQYNQYSARARTSEAKIGLAGLFTSEQAYFADSASYTSCVSAIGFVITPNYYTIGFPTASNGAVSTPGGGTCAPAANVSFYTAVQKAGGAAPGTPPAATTATAAATLFTAGAMGNVSRDVTDVWTINHNKVLSNNVSGI